MPKTYVRIGTHTEKEYIYSIPAFPHGLVVGAHLLEITPSATISLILKAMKNNPDLDLILDPVTFAFGIPPNGGHSLQHLKSEAKEHRPSQIKESYVTLASRLGGEFQRAVAMDQAIDFRFLDDIALRELGSSVVNYQVERFRELWAKDTELARFVDHAPRPSAALAPYFFLNPATWPESLKALEQLALGASDAGQSSSIPVHAVVNTSPELLGSQEFRRALLGSLIRLPIDTVWLWLDQFVETTAPTSMLVELGNFVREASQHCKVNIRSGGFFALCLAKIGVSAVAHGPGYGESRDNIPVPASAAPTIRFYLPPVHAFVGSRDFESRLSAHGIDTPEDYFSKVCNCPICRRTMEEGVESFLDFDSRVASSTGSGFQVQTSNAKKRATFHFLLCRMREAQRVDRTPTEVMIEQLREAAASWHDELFPRWSNHCSRWIEAFERLKVP